MFKAIINDAAHNFFKNMLDGLNTGLDIIGLITTMATWLLNMMSVPNAGKWCYTIFAFYIVLKVVLKALCLI